MISEKHIERINKVIKDMVFDYDGKIVLSEKLSIKCRIILRNCLVKDFSKRWNI